MKRLLLAAAAIAAASVPALAAEPPTLVMPTPLMTVIGQYLAHQPYADVAGMMSGLQQCATVQTPNVQGVIVSHGECPVVTATLADTDALKAQIAKLTKELDAAKAKQTPAPVASAPPAPTSAN